MKKYKFNIKYGIKDLNKLLVNIIIMCIKEDYDL